MSFFENFNGCGDDAVVKRCPSSLYYQNRGWQLKDGSSVCQRDFSAKLNCYITNPDMDNPQGLNGQ